MLMSKSRLEKFLYALYSLDSSDLPNPLSRIEELYKCLITGEEPPTFEPLSRVEKYLMAILGGYDDSLPNPLSRVEVLLYKLAMGYDDLDDVKSFLSEHEELLAEIIRNGGVGGNIDIEYVLYTLSTEFNTLYNTAEKPVKSAILKGQTLVNLVKQDEAAIVYTTRKAITNGFRYTQLYNSTSMGATRIQWDKETGVNLFTLSTKYYIQCDIKVNKPRVLRVYSNRSSTRFSYKFLENESTHIKGTFVTAADSFDYIYFYVAPPEGSNLEDYANDTFEIANLIIVEYQEGMENWDSPYFEGMQSVKMPVLTTTGKNLLDVTILDEESEGSGWSYKRQGETMEFISDGASAYQMYLKDITSDLINKLKVGKTYTLSSDITLLTEAKSAVQIAITYVDGTYDYIESHVNGSYSIEIKQKIKQIRFRLVGQSSSNASTSHLIVKNIQLEESSTPTTYEPYKSNILTVNEDVELRGIGDVKDELDLINGETIRKVGKITLNGSENWSDADNALSNTHRFQVSLSTFKSGSILLNDGGFDNITFGTSYTDTKNIQISGEHAFIRTLRNEVDSLDDFKSFLSSNPLTIIGELAVGTTSDTIDISVVDQDGNDAKLSTFDDLTHVTLSSEGLIPEAELEVATKNEEVLNTMSLEMDDISTTQTTLEETSNTQSENVDATMLATTEIYEQLL